jgi:hypothetical protein
VSAIGRYGSNCGRCWTAVPDRFYPSDLGVLPDRGTVAGYMGTRPLMVGALYHAPPTRRNCCAKPRSGRAPTSMRRCLADDSCRFLDKRFHCRSTHNFVSPAGSPSGAADTGPAPGRVGHFRMMSFAFRIFAVSRNLPLLVLFVRQWSLPVPALGRAVTAVGASRPDRPRKKERESADGSDRKPNTVDLSPRSGRDRDIQPTPDHFGHPLDILITLSVT